MEGLISFNIHLISHLEYLDSSKMTFFITWKKSGHISGWFIFKKNHHAQVPLYGCLSSIEKKFSASEAITSSAVSCRNWTPWRSVVSAFQNQVKTMTRKGSFNRKTYPIGSMYAIYGNIYHQYTPNVSIYTIHGSYGYGKMIESICHRIG